MDSTDLLRQIEQYFSEHHRQAYLVGGSIRNLLLGEPPVDWDITIDGDAVELARGLAATLGGHYVHMHDKAHRVVVKREKEILIDIAPLNGNTIEDDLRQRDFTINAIAAPLSGVLRSLDASLIDPLNGASDIFAHCLKAVDSEVFRHDPLRMLRAVRMMMHYRLRLDPATASLIRRDAGLLPLAAVERIHDELYDILAPNGATKWLRLLDELGLLTILIPELLPARGMPQPSPHHWDVFVHSLEAVAALEDLATALVEGLQPGTNIGTQLIAPGSYQGLIHDSYIIVENDSAEIRILLEEAEEQGIFQLAFLTTPHMKLAALLHDIGKPVTYFTGEDGHIHFYNHPQAGVPIVQQIMTRLGASTSDRRLVQLVAAHHMRPGQLGQTEIVTPRAVRRYFVDLGSTGIAVALFSLADHLATIGPQLRDSADRPEQISSWKRHLAVVRLLLTRYIREREHILPPRLLSADEMMRRLQLTPGPLIGRLLELIAEAQAEGSISSKEEALWFAEEKLHQLKRS